MKKSDEEKLNYKNVIPVGTQVVAKKRDKMTKSGIILTDKKQKLIKGEIVKLGKGCQYREIGEIIIVHKSKTQAIPFDDDYFIIEENDILIANYDEQDDVF